MKIPLGILLGNKEFAKDKILVAPLEIKPHLKLPAGTILYKNANGESQTPIDKVNQVLNKLQERVKKAQDSRYVIDALENMDKIETLYFNNHHELVETNLVLVNVAFSSDLEAPDGQLFKILSTLYPLLYPTPDGKMKFSEIVKQLETKQIQILNDIALPYQEAFIVEYKDILDKNKYILLREKLGTLLKPYKRKELFDITSDGKELVRDNLFSYTKKFLYHKDELVTTEVESNPDIVSILNGDPEISYRYLNSRDGIFIADNNMEFLSKIKTFLKRNYFKVIGETISEKELERALTELRPKYLFLGSLGADDDFQVQYLNILDTFLKKENHPLNVFAFFNQKNEELENQLRGQGITFIFLKQDFIDNKASVFERLKNTFNLFEMPV